jgi:hypothetical protein
MLCHTFLSSYKFHKIYNYFSFEVLKKKIWANFRRITVFLPKNCHSKIWVWDPGSEIRDPEKTYSGSRIRIRNTVFFIKCQRQKRHGNALQIKHCCESGFAWIGIIFTGVRRIRIRRVRKFLGLQDPDPSTNKQKN